MLYNRFSENILNYENEEGMDDVSSSVYARQFSKKLLPIVIIFEGFHWNLYKIWVDVIKFLVSNLESRPAN